jgi:hypothetical protein
MMEEIHLDTSGPAAAPTAFYSNKTLSAPLSPPRPARTTAAAPTTVTTATTTGIGTTTAATAIVAARTATMVKTAVATPPATPPWFPTAPPPTTAGVPRHARRMCRGTLPCIPPRRPPASNGRRLSWPRRGLTPHRALSLGSSSSTSRPLLRLLQAGHGLGPAVARELFQHHGATAAPQLGQ